VNDVDLILARLTHPNRLWSRSECVSRPSPVPATPGLYGWYFQELPSGLDGSGCIEVDRRRLLYVGIAPSRPLARDGLPSTSTLRSRIRMHYAGNAEGSTLRFTLGSLLAADLRLQQDPTRRSKSFGEGEVWLSEWMQRNAYVTWIQYPEPWEIERKVVEKLDLPLNLAHNRSHPFWRHLSKARSRRRL